MTQVTLRQGTGIGSSEDDRQISQEAVDEARQEAQRAVESGLAAALAVPEHKTARRSKKDAD